MKRYNLGINGFDEKIQGGTNLLLLGPPLSGKEVFTKRFFYEAMKEEDGAGIYVSTTNGSKSIFNWFDRRNLSLSEYKDSFGIVDCVTESQDLEKPQKKDSVKFASSPVDLTDIGVKISNLIKEFYMNLDKEKIRLVIDTVSVMIMYSDVKTIFRFLHTFSGRIKSIDGVGLYVLEAGSHEDKTIKTLKQLMDASLETKENNGNRKIRLQSREANFDWENYEIEDTEITLS